MSGEDIMKMNNDELEKVAGGRMDGEVLFAIDEGRCLMCAACANVCPTFAIQQGDASFYILASSCVACGQCVGECPCGAIYQC